jgi:hypothetical protein
MLYLVSPAIHTSFVICRNKHKVTSMTDIFPLNKLLIMQATYLPTYLPTYLSIYLWLYSPSLDLGQFCKFFILYIVSRALWTGDQPVARLLPALRTAQTQNKCTQTSMPQEGFEPTIPVFEWAKTVRASDRAATVIGRLLTRQFK